MYLVEQDPEYIHAWAPSDHSLSQGPLFGAACVSGRLLEKHPANAGCSEFPARFVQQSFAKARTVAAQGFVVLALAFSVNAQEQKYPLRGMSVEGEKAFSEERILALTGLELGQSVDQGDFRTALLRISEAGAFDSLEFRYEPQGDGYAVTFVVVEVPQLYRVRVAGFDEPEDEIIALLDEKLPLFGESVPPTGSMVRSIGDVLQAHWKAAGNSSKVVGELTPIGSDQFEMLFQPETRLEAIAFVKFEGSEAVDVLDLQRMFNPIAIGEPYSESRIKELLHYNVRPLFEEEGRMGVKFCPCASEPDAETQGLAITVQVEDGPEYTFGEIEVLDPGPFSPDQIEEEFTFHKGGKVNMTLVNRARSELDKALQTQGYLKANSDLETPIDHEALTVGLQLTVTAGPQYSFNRLHIEGLDILSEPVIRKRWGLELGAPFNPSYPAYFLDRIREEQMFDRLSGTKWTRKIDEVRKTVDVTLEFLGTKQDKKRPGRVQSSRPF